MSTIKPTPRQKFVRRTYLCFTLTVCVALMVSCALLYAHLTDLPLYKSLRGQSIPLQFGLVVVLITDVLVGFSIGGWAWSRIGKRFLGITREDMEGLLLGGNLRIGCIDRANRRAINKLFGTERNG